MSADLATAAGRFREALDARDHQAAAQALESSRLAGSPVAIAITRLDHSPAALEHIVRGAVALYRVRTERSANVSATIAIVAPVLGAFGYVLGSPHVLAIGLAVCAIAIVVAAVLRERARETIATAEALCCVLLAHVTRD